jgi:inosine-uridine nucleoside N-ribohydrolase
MKLLSPSVLAAMLLVPPLHAAPVKLVFDTDMGNDIDDAMALVMIHALERRGACELLAVTSTKDHPKSAPFIDAINTFCGRPGVPIGAVRNGATPELGKYLGLIDQTDAAGKPLYPHQLQSGLDAPEAVALLRKTLASAADGSVTMVQVGFFTNFARLLESKADATSPLDGVALIKQKVVQLVIMAGSFQTIQSNTRYGEYNVVKDIPSAKLLANKWPTPVVWSGFEIGIAVLYPWDSVMRDYDYAKPHLIKEAYLAYVPQHPHERPTWDLTAALYAIYPDRGYFELSPPGQVSVDDQGHTDFTAKNGGNDRYLVLSGLQAARVREAFVQLCCEPPPRK